MRIRTTMIALAGAALFAFAGAGTAQAGESDVFVEHATAAGVLFAEGGHHGGDIFAAGAISHTIVAID